MVLGLCMIVGAGLCWGLSGVLLSYATKKGFDVAAFLLTQTVLSLLMALVFLPDYHALRHGPPRLGMLVAVLLAAGGLNAVGIYSMQRAMRAGHHGIVWAIGQSALVFPFLAGVTFFHEPLAPQRLAGVLAIIASLALFGFARETVLPDASRSGCGAWIWLALLALCIIGVSQTLTTAPSHWEGWSDTAKVRVPLLSLGNAGIYLAMLLQRPRVPSRPVVWLAVLGSVKGIAASILLFRGLDALASVRQVSIGYPLAVGICILGFTVYSILVLRETTSRWHLAGFAACVLGILLIAV